MFKNTKRVIFYNLQWMEAVDGACKYGSPCAFVSTQLLQKLRMSTELKRTNEPDERTALKQRCMHVGLRFEDNKYGQVALKE